MKLLTKMGRSVEKGEKKISLPVTVSSVQLRYREKIEISFIFRSISRGNARVSLPFASFFLLPFFLFVPRDVSRSRWIMRLCNAIANPQDARPSTSEQRVSPLSISIYT